MNGVNQHVKPSRKISVSLPADLIYYLDDAIHEHGFASRSAVIAAALNAMRQHELETA